MVHVLQTTQNLVISRCWFAEDGKEIYKDSKRTCTAIVLLIKPFVSMVTFPLPSPSWFRNSLMSVDTYPSIFSRQMEAVVYITSRILWPRCFVILCQNQQILCCTFGRSCLRRILQNEKQGCWGDLWFIHVQLFRGNFWNPVHFGPDNYCFCMKKKSDTML